MNTPVPPNTNSTLGTGSPNGSLWTTSGFGSRRDRAACSRVVDVQPGRGDRQQHRDLPRRRPSRSAPARRPGSLDDTRIGGGAAPAPRCRPRAAGRAARPRARASSRPVPERHRPVRVPGRGRSITLRRGRVAGDLQQPPLTPSQLATSPRSSAGSSPPCRSSSRCSTPPSNNANQAVTGASTSSGAGSCRSSGAASTDAQCGRAQPVHVAPREQLSLVPQPDRPVRQRVPRVAAVAEARTSCPTRTGTDGCDRPPPTPVRGNGATPASRRRRCRNRPARRAGARPSRRRPAPAGRRPRRSGPPASGRRRPPPPAGRPGGSIAAALGGPGTQIERYGGRRTADGGGHRLNHRLTAAAPG